MRYYKEKEFLQKGKRDMNIVGIDLGTTNSAVATIWMDRPEILPNRYGSRITPSVVGITKRNKILVGSKAKYQRATLLEPPIKEIKRYMGTDYVVNMGGKKHTPEEISAYILRSVKSDAQQFLESEIGCAVITIPAYFNEAARRATRKAGELAGLHVGMILDEPTAAALAYSAGSARNETVLIYDLGGGTFDVSIIEISGKHFEVLSIDGNTHLGGKDFDQLLMDYVVQEVYSRHKFTLDPALLSKLSVIVENTKCDLSYYKDSFVLFEGVTDKIDIDIPVKRELLEELVRPLVISTLEPVRRALHKANLEKEEIDKVLLVGGSTRMPLVKETVESFFGKPPKDELNPDECVALGAAIYTKLLDEATLKKYQSVSWPSQEEDKENFVVIPRTAHSLGIGVDEGGSEYSVVLAAGSFYPISITRKEYFTSVENQKGLEIWVYEGENPVATKNIPIGRVILDLPQGLSAGTPVWITFSLNESRILEVSVALPDKPNVKAKICIDTKNISLLPSKEISSPGTPLASWQRQCQNMEDLLKKNKALIDPSRYVEIVWALENARDALEKGDSKVSSNKMHILDHIYEELVSLEKDIS
ncbi:MAG: Hsp70 family protein [Candidatus Brocadiae bacterium]|nr:Hsp70 family protein [Candidatus Brocadiia bacterium]